MTSETAGGAVEAGGAAPAVGRMLRARRVELGLTLQRVADLAECSKAYLSAIETGRRGAPPSEDMLGRIERALGLEAGRLVEAARWQETPAQIRLEVERLQSRERAARQLAEVLRAMGGAGTLDAAFRSGDLKRLIARATPDPAGGGGGGVGELAPLGVARSADVPLINSVAAGYPAEFTDLGYPARVADEYVRTPDVDDPDAFAARVVGDSMEPEYREGDIVVFSPARVVRAGMDCFARLDGAGDQPTTFKRVYFETSGAGREMIRLQPLNPAYPPAVFERERVAGLYAAVSVTRSLR
ncbi:MAG: helix-turn-helix domain-containing protein [Phycisphaeraceae bacterium]|nr:helix-turn-helix domain-containing protein [Phycisphaeraceae bacterium]